MTQILYLFIYLKVQDFTAASRSHTQSKNKNILEIQDVLLLKYCKNFLSGGGNADLPQNSLKARAPRNSLIINAEIISHNHFPTTRPEKQFSPLISRHRTRVTGLQ